MEIKKTVNGTELTVAPVGRLDTVTSAELDAFLKEQPAEINSLIFDLSELEYISSAGLHVLLSASKAMKDKGTMKVIHANDIVSEIFAVTGFTDILTIE